MQSRRAGNQHSKTGENAEMTINKFMSAEAAVALINDGDTVA